MRQADLFLVFCLVAFAAGFLLVVMPVEIRLLYRGKAGGHSLSLRFGLFRGKLGIGTKLIFDRGKKGFRLVERLKIKSPGGAGCKERRHTPSSPGGVFAGMARYQKLLKYTGRFMKNSICKRLIWETDLGFQDYALTGVAAGMIWAGKGLALGYLSRFLKINPQVVRVHVTPHFGSPRLETSLDCILMTRLGHIISTFSYILIWWIKITWYNNRRGVSRVGGPSD